MDPNQKHTEKQTNGNDTGASLNNSEHAAQYDYGKHEKSDKEKGFEEGNYDNNITEDIEEDVITNSDESESSDTPQVN